MKKLNITINFDMDGTIADLYGVDNWLEYLINEDVYPYANAQPLPRLCTLARKLNALQRAGYASNHELCGSLPYRHGRMTDPLW